MRQKVVIIGHSFSSRLSLIRSIAHIGCEITVIVMTELTCDGKTLNITKPIDCYSKYVNNVYYCYRKDKNAFIRLLLEYCTDSKQKVVLIPDSDDTVVAIDDNRDKLNKYFYFPHIIRQPNSIRYWMDKSNQKKLAREIGLNVANAQIVDIVDGHYTIPKNICYPCYTKPLATMNGGKGGMMRCDQITDLLSAIDFFITYRNRTGKILVEDYKEISTEYALLGLSDGKNVIIPGILQLLEISKVNKGIALQGKVMPVHGFEDIIELFKKLVLRIGFVGLFDIDFYDSEGKMYFCELNLRFGGSGYAVTKMGVNLPAMYVNMCIGKDGISNKKVNGSAIYVNERMCMADWNFGYMTNRQFDAYLDTADILFISDGDDWQPEKVFNKICLRRRIINSAKRILKKFKLL